MDTLNPKAVAWIKKTVAGMGKRKIDELKTLGRLWAEQDAETFGIVKRAAEEAMPAKAQGRPDFFRTMPRPLPAEAFLSPTIANEQDLFPSETVSES